MSTLPFVARSPWWPALAWLLLPAGSGAAGPAPALPEPHLTYRAVLPATTASDPARADWRDSNRLMRQLGGHAGHAAPAGTVPGPAAAPTAAAAAPPPAPPQDPPPAAMPRHPHPMPTHSMPMHQRAATPGRPASGATGATR